MVAKSIYRDRKGSCSVKENGFAEKQWPAQLEKAVLLQICSMASEWFVKFKLLNRKWTDTDDRTQVNKEGCG